ncbi:MAG: serpin family protein [Gemmatimonadota bacterium]|nr:serpin family protein [Gemmatimonadota bacterium]
MTAARYPMIWRSVAALALAAAGACSSEPPTGPPKALEALPRPLTSAEQQVAAAGNTFSFSLFRQINQAQRDSNVFISPLSASMALGMTMNGAAGATYDGMRTTIGFGGAAQPEINDGYKGLIALLRGLDSHTDFRIANSIWYRNTFPFEQSFLNAGERYFDAEIRPLDFADPASLTTINNWVDRSTNGKIEEIIESIEPLDVMFLINAIYFKANWRSPFDKSDTRDAPFYAADGSTQTARLMHQQKAVRYLETPELQAVDLLYGNTAFAMTVLLPKQGTDVNALVAGLTEEKWNAWTDQFREHEIALYLPKFTLEYERTMNDDLTALGMGIAFVPRQADFTPMSPLGRELYISYVKQKTYVDVHEEGTEAAAVTAVGIRVVSMPPTMRVDRPFVFAIRERFSGTILFVGKMVRMPNG